MKHFFVLLVCAFTLASFASILLFVPLVVEAGHIFGHASAPGSGSNAALENPLGPGGPITLMEFIRLIITDIILPMASVLVVLAIIYTGFLFVAARGNPAKLEHARTAFVWTVIGTAVLLGSWVIAVAIEGTLCEITGGTIPGLCN
ncbi:MAG: hypothetical protein WDZ79_02445 [Candidatus Paceibacterota bacterium]